MECFVESKTLFIKPKNKEKNMDARGKFVQFVEFNVLLFFNYIEIKK